MKKFLILSALLFAIPTFAACPIDGSETVCQLPGFREQVEPIYNHKSNISEFSGTPAGRLNPVDRSDIGQQIRQFSPAESDYSYNSSCQFGVCMQNRSTPLFQQPKQ